MLPPTDISVAMLQSSCKWYGVIIYLLFQRDLLFGEKSKYSVTSKWYGLMTKKFNASHMGKYNQKTYFGHILLLLFSPLNRNLAHERKCSLVFWLIYFSANFIRSLMNNFLVSQLIIELVKSEQYNKETDLIYIYGKHDIYFSLYGQLPGHPWRNQLLSHLGEDFQLILINNWQNLKCTMHYGIVRAIVL